MHQGIVGVVILAGLIILLVGCFILIGGLLWLLFIEPGAVYYPTQMKVVKKMLDLAEVGKKDTVVDLGSGDGRFLVAAAQRGARAIGYEINPWLVARSRQAIKKAGVQDLATVCWGSLWHADFNQATVICLYLFPHLMDRLQKDLEQKLRQPIKLVSNDYTFSQKKPIKKIGKIYLYRFG